MNVCLFFADFVSVPGWNFYCSRSSRRMSLLLLLLRYTRKCVWCVCLCKPGVLKYYLSAYLSHFNSRLDYFFPSSSPTPISYNSRVDHCATAFIVRWHFHFDYLSSNVQWLCRKFFTFGRLVFSRYAEVASRLHFIPAKPKKKKLIKRGRSMCFDSAVGRCVSNYVWLWKHNTSLLNFREQKNSCVRTDGKIFGCNNS